MDGDDATMLVSGLLLTAAVLSAATSAVFFIEILAAVGFARPQFALPPRAVARRVAVLVPAHNESTGVLPTLADIRRQLLAGDRLLVVADNCTDDTAAAAAAHGAEVIERNDATKRGKGYALEFGVRHLGSDPPEVVIIVDADCRLADDSIDQLARACAMTGRPAQALNLMTAPRDSQIEHQVAEFAWRVKNWLRPLGLDAMKLPCQLMGTGMAFPWAVINAVELGNGCIAEDLILGLEMAAAGHPALFCPTARVTSQFPALRAGAVTQRRRWEHGHIDTILTAAPHLLTRAVVHRDWCLLALSLDVAVPPLSLLGTLVVGIVGASALAAHLGCSAAAFCVSVASLLALSAGTFLAWLKCGRDVLPPWALLLIPAYVIGKFGFYGQFLWQGAESRWLRTDRRTSSE
ncbi:MAG: glycosyltransferase family 2 protein [Xanthobacteraceae bacterium]|jgi:cellulose synthase/poly-beta-1,6-N-acetylglucosamine synthase-like glycosyltransferase